MTRQHWMIEVRDSINRVGNKYRLVQQGYFDGSKSEAAHWFKTSSPWDKYFGDTRYQIIMRTNPVILQDAE